MYYVVVARSTNVRLDYLRVWIQDSVIGTVALGYWWAIFEDMTILRSDTARGWRASLGHLGEWGCRTSVPGCQFTSLERISNRQDMYVVKSRKRAVDGFACIAFQPKCFPVDGSLRGPVLFQTYLRN